MDKREEWRDYGITIALIVINTGIFLYMFLTGRPESAAYMAQHGAMYPDLITEGGEYYRFITSCFLHFDMNHLMSNMLLLGAAGRYVEEAIGHVRFGILYLLAGTGGSLLSFAGMLYSGEYAVSAGASGAIFGLLGGLLWIVIYYRGRYERLTGRGMFGMILLALYSGFSSGNVDNMAHLGGLFVGFALAIPLWYNRRKHSR